MGITDTSDGEARPGAREVRVEAPAKVNLYLDVLGRRDDGYHEIDTVMQAVDLADELVMRARSDGRLTLSVTGRSGGVPDGEANLVMKAARALAGHIRRREAKEAERVPEKVPDTLSTSSVEIALHKRIPPGSGLGGGSSDAAATLVGLSRLWGLELSRDELLPLAAALGSDVPFFLRGGTARCRARGEIVEPLTSRGELHAVIVFSAPLSTKDVYAAFDGLTSRRPASRKAMPLQLEGRLDLSRVAEAPLWNSLEEAAFELRPDLRRVKRAVLAAGAGAASLSGSGSSVFGVFTSREAAERAAGKLAEDGHDTVVVSSTGPRST